MYAIMEPAMLLGDQQHGERPSLDGALPNVVCTCNQQTTHVPKLRKLCKCPVRLPYDLAP